MKKNLAEQTYFIDPSERLEPRRPWQHGLISDTLPYALEEAARLATRQAGTEVTEQDFLAAAAEGLIRMHAIVRQQAMLEVCREGDSLPTNTHGLPAGTVPKGALMPLPREACRSLAGIGEASWRTYEGYGKSPYLDDALSRFVRYRLIESDADFETQLSDCRIIGYDVHALADADPA